MALPYYALEVIKKHVPFQNRAWFLSYPDITVSIQKLSKLFNISPALLEEMVRADSKDIMDWHKAHSFLPEQKIVCTNELFRHLGFSYRIFTDLVKARGPEYIVDLNHPIDVYNLGKFEFIYDNVLDHCFNIEIAFRNIVSSVTLGGHILHLTPLLMINHGFYNISPTFFYDFYLNNGFEIVEAFGVHGLIEEKQRFKLESFKRMKDIPHDSMQIILVKKIKERSFHIPIQSKFLKYPNSKVSSPATS